ncbi:DUF1753-domain-containing protein [Polychaeton citri CBS 116435]|uniref:DUF1753-domain-containing protein n=1 Tax=Polychaeton citri CBS 116435 TaxID=1314669 RepID=A0A9P4Q1D2_9PEZI|nr:DUF1753-domain-containing protein [Polychaeton citri CBS 116435]
MATPTIVRILRPRSIFSFISLRSAAEWITMTLLVNKVTGLYGILALFTGYSLNPLQLSLYVYSLIVLGIAAYLTPAIRRNDKPLRVLTLAWLYVLDTIINSVYTGLFSASYFLILAQHLQGNEHAPQAGGNAVSGPGAGTMNDTAGFTDPEHPDVSEVEVVAKPATGSIAGQEAVAYGSTHGSLGSAVFQSGSVASITVLSTLWLVRVYMCLIMLSYARTAVRGYIAKTSDTYAQSDEPGLAENPFRVGREEGQGWRGNLGRALLSFPTKRYWLGRDEAEEEWIRNTQGRFGNRLRIKVPEAGVGERERRARRGTGPPPKVES